MELSIKKSNPIYRLARISHSENLESYKHKCAKDVLLGWLGRKYTVRTEESFISFIPDISVYDENGIVAFYEVVHASSLSDKKLHKIQKWSYLNDIPVKVYEVEAEWILRQCRIPKKIKCFVFNI